MAKATISLSASWRFVGAPSWTAELTNLDESGCTFVLLKEARLRMILLIHLTSQKNPLLCHRFIPNKRLYPKHKQESPTVGSPLHLR